MARSYQSILETQGNIFSVLLESGINIKRFFLNRAVVVSDYKMIRTTFSKNECIGRTYLPPGSDNDKCEDTGETLDPLMPIHPWVSHNYSSWAFSGIIYSEGQTWKEQRGFLTRSLRHINFALQDIEKFAKVEMEDLYKKLSETDGKPIVPNGLFILGITNILWQLIARRRYEPGDKEMEQLLQDRI